ncbi:MAG: hypothetical protein A4E20_11040 [Nitrospira sp. SG-bin2]|uniref:hypothetical protein n=1 Tax=Nitrospira cf. moscoviensis SBR1015 TaxID=96242 RepID=UPI000A0A5B58|nr:hypothetical protein [Nitrospira cf. moscoviensis SBR1015]OQW34548.1 MAG: hypothetical protein A4E20_11040 [Nitrospira sp. SG-bin2]
MSNLAVAEPLAEKLFHNPKGDISLMVMGREYRLMKVTKTRLRDEGYTTVVDWAPLDELLNDSVAHVGWWRLRLLRDRLRIRVSRLRWLTWAV